MTLTIRRGGAPEDVAAIGELHARSRRSAYRELLTPQELAEITAADQQAKWARRWAVEADTHRLHLAVRGDTVLGFCYLGPAGAEEQAPAGTGMLNAIHVRPDAVGSGVGLALMNTCLAEFAALGHHRAMLYVVSDNTRARRFYERGGWAADGVTRTTPIGPADVPVVRYARPIP
ncbi:GNAT family N-acetyltransferase [Catellatospora chokoriensis]|uniref:N-acetyltransferase n=1 Tax=Catellatospora chokoriensis TaxID=310353 RepID=A0A8J3JX93_9ACTN|nr:GNAT family N-acetyltransferase [Catellatospora chokoriensis]GIF88568.1 N-acetyltransferase [Catellatospora chokoriensis]